MTPLLIDVHWLPVSAQISYNVLLFTYKALHGVSAAYLTNLLMPYISHRQLRSAIQEKISQPLTHNLYGDQVFSCAAPKLWNTLPLEHRRLPSMGAFKAQLKTHLFRTHCWLFFSLIPFSGPLSVNSLSVLFCNLSCYVQYFRIVPAWDISATTNCEYNK